jgi:8-oxo-dGTP pyrophosphatase MutT (NUDIX family)
MPMSEYMRGLRQQVGHGLLMLPSVSAVVLNDSGELLLGQRSDNGQWSLISGNVDPGEQPADAMVREIYEEAGVHAVIERLAGVALHPFTYPDGDQCHYLNVWFRCRAVGGHARVNDDESVAVGWFSLDGLPEIQPWVRLRIDVALKDEPMAWFARPGTHHDALGFPPPACPA